jgi:hypothetical protein
VSFDWSEYLNLANALAGPTSNPSTDEAQLRSAISRAYYANYCIARNHLREKEAHTIPWADAHKYVIDQFRNSPDRARRDLGNDLNRLKISRHLADCEDEYPGLLGPSTRVALTLAGQVIIKLKNL